MDKVQLVMPPPGEVIKAIMVYGIGLRVAVFLSPIWFPFLLMYWILVSILTTLINMYITLLVRLYIKFADHEMDAMWRD